MTYTADTLRVLNDFERNKILAEMVMLKLGTETWVFDNNKDKVQFLNEKTGVSRVVDYCKNPNDITPLAFEHKIGVEFIDGFGWTASHAYDLTSASCYDNPLRAMVMCLILHLQERGV